MIDEATKLPVSEFQIAGTVRRIYGERMHDLLNRVTDMFRHMAELEKNAGRGAIDIDLRDDSEKRRNTVNPAFRYDLPFFLDNGQPVKWYAPQFKNVADTQKQDDVRNILEDFISRSGNFFYTKEKVKAP